MIALFFAEMWWSFQNGISEWAISVPRTFIMAKKYGNSIVNYDYWIEEDESSDPMENELEQSAGDEISSEDDESRSENPETLSSNEEGTIDKNEFSLDV